jgi:hypothetical protein
MRDIEGGADSKAYPIGGGAFSGEDPRYSGRDWNGAVRGPSV